MYTGTITIRKAIHRGLKVIALPSKVIVISSMGLFVLLLFLSFSWWVILILPAGPVISIIYTLCVTPRWRIWAYESVSDIHQFQRSAELAGLLMKQSHDKAGGIIVPNQRRRLKTAQARFSEEVHFTDDPSIADETLFYPKSANGQVLVLSNTGIKVGGDLLEWAQIKDERIVQVSFSRMSPRTGADIPAGTKDFFRFEHLEKRFELPLSSLDIEAWELDLLLYIYRGRSEMAAN